MAKVKPDTAKNYLKALRSHHVEKGYDTAVFSDARVDLLIRGGKRFYGEGVKRLRLPLTHDILVRIIHGISNDYNGINVKAALCVAFAAFLRSGEFTWETWDPSTSPRFALARQHVTFNKDGSATLFLPASKTDPSRRGVPIQLAAVPTSPLCPVTALRILISRCPALPNQPMFARISGGPFNRQYIVAQVRELLLRAGLQTTGFSGHSIRKGAAVTAWNNGISKDEIKLMGRWKSDAVLIYINEVEESQHAHRLQLLGKRLLRTPPAIVPHSTSRAHLETTPAHAVPRLASTPSPARRRRRL